MGGYTVYAGSEAINRWPYLRRWGCLPGNTLKYPGRCCFWRGRLFRWYTKIEWGSQRTHHIVRMVLVAYSNTRHPKCFAKPTWRSFVNCRLRQSWAVSLVTILRDQTSDIFAYAFFLLALSRRTWTSLRSPTRRCHTRSTRFCPLSASTLTILSTSARLLGKGGREEQR